jgi:hypothetical protein
MCEQYHMRTYSAHRRVTSSGHPLNGGLDGYYRGICPRYREPLVTTQKLLDMIDSLHQQTVREPYTLYQETTLALQAEEMGPPTKIN